LTSPNNTPVFEESIKKASAFGATPFEVVNGSPAARYGARITFRLPSNKRDFLAHFALEGHPWGAPDWAGIRIADQGGLRVKPYHRVVTAGPLPFHPDLTRRLRPIMASLSGGVREEYLRLQGTSGWNEFADACTTPWNGSRRRFEPFPKTVDSAFCVSAQFQDEELQAITCLADHRSLPDDDSIARSWIEDLSPGDAQAYELAYAAVRANGRRRLGSWHAMLGWTLERGGAWHKAVSLRFGF
jgi:hypothetical protein